MESEGRRWTRGEDVGQGGSPLGGYRGSDMLWGVVVAGAERSRPECVGSARNGGSARRLTRRSWGLDRPSGEMPIHVSVTSSVGWAQWGAHPWGRQRSCSTLQALLYWAPLSQKDAMYQGGCSVLGWWLAHHGLSCGWEGERGDCSMCTGWGERAWEFSARAGQ